MTTLFRSALVLSTLAALPAAAAPDYPVPETRLLAAGGPDADGRWRLGLEIVLPDGWHTYWRQPGDAGVPPAFDPAASRNLAAFDVGYPVPERYFDGFGTSLVYHGRVVLPVSVAAADPAAPVEVRVRFDYGYCKEICIPASADLAADLVPGHAPDPHDAGLVAAAFDALPVPEARAPEGAPTLASVAVVGRDREGHVDVAVETPGDPAALDLFVEGPDRWYLSPPERLSADGRRALFRIALGGMPKTATPAGATLRFTLTDGRHAIEATRTLD